MIAFAAFVGVGVYVFHGRTQMVVPSTPAAKDAASCDARVTKPELERSIELGTQFMVSHQKPAGNFDYEYDWQAKRNAKDDNAARQSGALWGLSLLHQFAGPKASPELRSALGRGLAYFDDSSVKMDRGWRYPVYRGDGDTPKGTTGGMGMAAIVTLAIMDYMRSLPAMDGGERSRWTGRVNEYIDFVAGSIRTEGTWPADYRYDTGAGVGAHSPYSDGEALLSLVIAMKYLGRDDLRPEIEHAAKEGHRVNVVEARAQEADSATTKGYYQWSSMALYELATSPMAAMTNAPPYGEWLLDLGDWILDVHHVISRERNTGYAFEGLVSSYAWAKKTKDPRAEKYRCAIHLGLSNLLGWQIGHPRAAALGGGDDPKAVGGVQNHARGPGLRIDVVQHQMHATMMAHEHLFE